MPTVVCQNCGASWSNDNAQSAEFSARLFSTPTMPQSALDPLSVNQVVLSGEALLTCPKDAQEPLDSAIERKGQGPNSQARKTGRRDNLRQW